MGKRGPKLIEPIQRFNKKYIIDEETGCWNWIGSISKYGYGKFTIKFQDGFILCHSCNNRKCVNPWHLRQDTYKSNSIDMVIANRQRCQKLSVSQVIEIKKELEHYYRGQYKNLSDIYGVTPTAIQDIKAGRTWSHVKI
jgi:hypothetical protein